MIKTPFVLTPFYSPFKLRGDEGEVWNPSTWFDKLRPVLSTVHSFESLRMNGVEGMTGLNPFALSLSKGKLSTNVNAYQF